MKIFLALFTTTLTFLMIAPVCQAGDYFQYSTTNGRTTNHTYVDNRTGATCGGYSTQSGNTSYHNTPDYYGYSTTNGNITTHTYINRRTGAVTGGSSWRNGNTTYNYGNPPPYPYKQNK